VIATALLTMAPIGQVVVGGREPIESSRGSSDQESAVLAINADDEGRRLFRKETFGGNGRTCETCHSPSTGTLSPEDVRLKSPSDPLFLQDGLDDGVSGTSRIAEHATIRIVRPLPPSVRIAEDPSATSVVLLRGIPSTLNTPALDPALMYDLRARTLSDQALGAIHDHAQNSVEPTQKQLALIADVQRTDKRFFSSDVLRDFASGGPAPVLPPGRTASEQRGRLMFVETEITPGSTKGICAQCHAGPMLNQTSAFNTGAPPGARIANIGVSERNLLNLPVYTVPDRQWRRRRASGHYARCGDPIDQSPSPWRAPTVRSAPSLLRRLLQDSVALGREENCSVLSRQQREDAGRGRRLLHEHVCERPGFRAPTHGSGRSGHGCLSEVASMRTAAAASRSGPTTRAPVAKNPAAMREGASSVYRYRRGATD
jgi:hypothetical protein